MAALEAARNDQEHRTHCYTSNPWIVSLASAPYSLRIEFQKLVSTMVQISSSSTSSRGRLLCLECTIGLEFLYLRVQGLERLYHLRLRSPRPLMSFSLPFQHNSCFPLVGQQLTAAMWTVLSVLVEGAWSLLIARVWGVFRASLVPAVLVGENQAVAQDEVGRGTECCETTLFSHNIEAVQSMESAAGHRWTVQVCTE